MKGLLRLFRESKELTRFKSLEAAARAIVFYSEDAASWAHLGPIVDDLIDNLDRRVCYVTSDANDPIIKRDHPNLTTFCLGNGMVRTIFFSGLQARVLVMTMPDLETFQIKRSTAHSVHYVYVFHSVVSTHMIYRTGAFDHFETILCSGPHHVKEVRATEEVYGLKAKELVEHGYGRLDLILAAASGRDRIPPPSSTEQLRVLVAPSWGLEGLIEQSGVELVRVLLGAGFHVTVRPHPVTGKKWPHSLHRLTENFGGDRSFVLEEDVASQDSLHASHAMISDWSGAALEYAFGLERPVVFVDVPRKVNNPEYEKVPCVPLEVSIRDQVGEIVAPSELEDVPAAIQRLCAEPDAYRERIQRLRSEAVYNIGRSGAVGAQAISELADRAPAQERESPAV